MDAAVIAENAASRAALTALLGRLTGAHLARPLGDGWTVGTALAHLAFWDRRAFYVLGHWEEGRVPPAAIAELEWYDDLPNEALRSEWAVIPPHTSARLAIEAAEAVDARVARLPDTVAAEIVSRDEAWRFSRFHHRREHVDQIERALAAR